MSLTRVNTQEQAKVVARFELTYTALLDKDGHPTTDLDLRRDNAIWVELYQAMVLTRLFEKKATNLQRTGRLGIYASALGQEAIAVAIGQAMKKQDVLCPYYREAGAQLQRSVGMDEILLYWGGDERGSAYHNGGEDLPVCITLACQCLHAAGVARAFQLREQDRVAVTVVGDGGTSRGDFSEAVNLAGVWQLPLVIVVNNNQWAISVPIWRQTAAKTLAQKAFAGEIAARQVDGNDAIAMRYAMDEALERARSGGGPTLIEALTYRVGDHSTIDDARRYREASEVEQACRYDPIVRLRKYLQSEGYWGPDQEEQWLSQCEQEVSAAVKRYLDTSAAQPSAMFDYMYERWPSSLDYQRRDLERISTYRNK